MLRVKTRREGKTIEKLIDHTKDIKIDVLTHHYDLGIAYASNLKEFFEKHADLIKKSYIKSLPLLVVYQLFGKDFKLLSPGGHTISLSVDDKPFYSIPFLVLRNDNS